MNRKKEMLEILWFKSFRFKKDKMRKFSAFGHFVFRKENGVSLSILADEIHTDKNLEKFFTLWFSGR